MTKSLSMKQGEIWLVSLDPTARHEQSGSRPVLIVSPVEFNEATKLPVILPITNGGEFARRPGFAVPVPGIMTTGVVRRDQPQPRVIDLAARHARKVDTLQEPILNKVLARIATLVEQAKHEHGKTWTMPLLEPDSGPQPSLGCTCRL